MAAHVTERGAGCYDSDESAPPVRGQSRCCFFDWRAGLIMQTPATPVGGGRYLVAGVGFEPTTFRL